MKSPLVFAQAILVAAGFLVGVGCSGKNSTSLAIPTDSLPKLITDAVNQAKPGGTIVSAVREEEKGEVVYEVKVVVDGQYFEMEVDQSGKVLDTDTETDSTEFQGIDTLPQLIVDAVNQAKPGSTIVSGKTEEEDGELIYEVTVLLDGQNFEVEVDQSGKVLEIEKKDD